MLIGHQKQWNYLRGSVESGKVAHAYLFYGPARIGKKTIALEFAKLLNCYNSNTNACGRCVSCQEISKNISSNLLLLEPVGNEKGSARSAIHIGQIRELKSRLSLTSGDSSYKIAVIDEAAALTADAQGALLKLLEEPKGKTVIVLVAKHLDEVLPTIVSRCQPVRFGLLNGKEIEKHLKEKFSLEEAQEISQLCFGRPGIALEYLEDAKKIESQKRKIKEIIGLTKAPLKTRFRYAEKLAQQRDELDQALGLWLNYFRELLLGKISSKAESIFLEADDYSVKKLKNILKLIEKIRFIVASTNVNPRLALEVLLMKI